MARPGRPARPPNPEALVHAFQRAAARSDWAAAIAALDGLIAIAPGAALSYNKAVALRRAGRPAEAAVAARDALVRDPAHANALFELAAALMDQGERPAAIAAFERFLVAQPDDVDACVNLAALWLAEGDPARALAVIGRAAGSGADRIRAQAHRDIGELDEAERHAAALPAPIALKLATQGATGRIPLDARRWRGTDAAQ